jgi:hypothetical protein
LLYKEWVKEVLKEVVKQVVVLDANVVVKWGQGVAAEVLRQLQVLSLWEDNPLRLHLMR